MRLYAVYQVDQGYDGFESLDSIWFNETNARRALEALKEVLLAGHTDTRFKQWWVEKPGEADILVRFQLYDKSFINVKDNHTTIFAEIRVLQTGDENAA